MAGSFPGSEKAKGKAGRRRWSRKEVGLVLGDFRCLEGVRWRSPTGSGVLYELHLASCELESKASFPPKPQGLLGPDALALSGPPGPPGHNDSSWPTHNRAAHLPLLQCSPEEGLGEETFGLPVENVVFLLTSDLPEGMSPLWSLFSLPPQRLGGGTMVLIRREWETGWGDG